MKKTVIDRRISVAPMMGWTDRHDRYFLRLISPHALLYTVMLTTGALLFSSVAVDAYGNVYFRIKVLLLLLAGVNTLVFHSTVYRRRSDWDTAAVPPRR